MCRNCHWPYFGVTLTTPNGTVVEVQVRPKPIAITAEAFYNYNADQIRSASTPDHLEEGETQKLFFTKQELGSGKTRVAFNLINDATFSQGGNAEGGSVHFKIVDHTLCGPLHPGQGPAHIVVRDDATDDVGRWLDPKDHLPEALCRDGRPFENRFIFFWGKNHTDGVVIADLPKKHRLWFTIDPVDCTGIEHISVVSWIDGAWHEVARVPAESRVKVKQHCMW